MNEIIQAMEERRSIRRFKRRRIPLGWGAFGFTGQKRNLRPGNGSSFFPILVQRASGKV